MYKLKDKNNDILQDLLKNVMSGFHFNTFISIQSHCFQWQFQNDT